MRAAQDVEGEVIHTWTRAAGLPKGPQHAVCSLRGRKQPMLLRLRLSVMQTGLQTYFLLILKKGFFTEKFPVGVSVNEHWLLFATFLKNI